MIYYVYHTILYQLQLDYDISYEPSWGGRTSHSVLRPCTTLVWTEYVCCLYCLYCYMYVCTVCVYIYIYIYVYVWHPANHILKKPGGQICWTFHVPRKPRVNQSPIGWAIWRNLAIQENVSATIVVQPVVCNVLCPPRWPATWPCAVLPNPHAGEATHYPQHNFRPRTGAGEAVSDYTAPPMAT